MKKRDFLKKIIAAGLVASVNPLNMIQYPKKDVVKLPFVDGDKRVAILSEGSGGGMAYAQCPEGAVYLHIGDCNCFANCQEFYSCGEVVLYWNQTSAELREHQEYLWFKEAHSRAMQQLISKYDDYGRIGYPSIMPYIHSIYAFAMPSYNAPVLFGLNKKMREVSIQKTLQGAAKVFESVNQFYGEREAEKSAGPQSNEQRAIISVPGRGQNHKLKGVMHETDNGFLAVSDDFVESEDGQVGQLVKYATGADGLQYAIV